MLAPGDLVKHTVYLAMLNHLARNGKKAHIVGSQL